MGWKEKKKLIVAVAEDVYMWVAGLKGRWGPGLDYKCLYPVNAAGSYGCSYDTKGDYEICDFSTPNSGPKWLKMAAKSCFNNDL